MTHILAVGHAASAGTVSTSGVTWFLLIVAAAAGARFSWLAPIGIFVLYLVTHAGAVHGAVHVSSSLLLCVVTAVVAGLVCWHLGGRAILRHIAEREYRNRLSSAKGISSIWKYWLGDSE